MEAAAVFGDGETRVGDLPGIGLAAQLQHQFVDLAEAGGADRMTLRLQSSGGIDRYPPAKRGLAAFHASSDERRAAWLRREGIEVACVDSGKDRIADALLASADLIAFLGTLNDQGE